MAVTFPNTDKPSGLSGGSDVWDNSTAGPILLGDYFVEDSGPVTYDVAATEAAAAGESSSAVLVLAADVAEAATAADLPNGGALATASQSCIVRYWPGTGHRVDTQQ